MRKIWTGNQRAPWHDYAERQIHHITLIKRKGIMPFGTLAGDWPLPMGSLGSPYIQASRLGTIIKTSLKDVKSLHPALKIYQYSLMPDHLHVLLSVEEHLDEILGKKLAAFKVMVNHKAHLENVFEKGFNDQILTTKRNLQAIFDYIRSNPYRLAVRRANPDFFTRCNNLVIGETPCQLYGNIHLLDNPFKEQVIVHRADGDDVYLANRDRWLYAAASGGVLVSPFISQREKAIRKEAEALGARFIQITNRPFGEREKPSGKDFDLCTEGRMKKVFFACISALVLVMASCSPSGYDQATVDALTSKIDKGETLTEAELNTAIEQINYVIDAVEESSDPEKFILENTKMREAVEQLGLALAVAQINENCPESVKKASKDLTKRLRKMDEAEALSEEDAEAFL